MWLVKGRPDWLAELQGMLTAVLVLAPLVMFWNEAPALGNGHTGPDVRASYVDGVAGATGGLRPGAEVTGGSQVEVLIVDPSGGQVVAWLFTWLPSFALFMTVVVLLRRLVRDARRGDPFTLTTVRRLRILAAVTLAGGAAASLLEYGAGLMVAWLALESGVFVEPYGFVRSTALLVGLAFLVIAEVVKRGCAMREELETVI
jgi:hypothetical protein